MLSDIRKPLSRVVLALFLSPLGMAAAVAAHEMEHHGQETHGHAQDLLAALHGHHHHSGVEDHDHPIVKSASAPAGVKAPQESRLLDAPSPQNLRWASAREDWSHRTPTQPRASGLCIWLL